MTGDLQTLLTVAGSDGAPDDWFSALDPIGLILQIPPRREEYWCTPLNCLTFARTGGDGVHFSFLDLPGATRDEQPIVMTVPMSDHPNLVVGATLRDFLALGCRTGYFVLEQLVHQPDEALSEIELGQFDPEASEGEVAMLTSLAKAFDLVPWKRPKAHLAELQLLHASSLQLPQRPSAV